MAKSKIKITEQNAKLLISSISEKTKEFLEELLEIVPSPISQYKNIKQFNISIEDGSVYVNGTLIIDI